MLRAIAFFRRALALVGLGAVVASGCYKSGDGPDPDDRAPYFPVGVALSQNGDWLFLVNSNFDLKYNAGTLQALKVGGPNGIAAKAKTCKSRIGDWRAGKPSEPTKPDCVLGTDPTQFVASSVRIGAFAADIEAIPRLNADGASVGPNAGRLLIPIRGDASITVVDYDVADADHIKLTCAPGAASNTFGTRCAPAWRLTGGDGAGSASRGLTLEGEPFALATSTKKVVSLGGGSSAVGITAVAHQSTGDVSLLIDTARETSGGPPVAKLAYTLGGLPPIATGIALLDIPGDTLPTRFLVTNRSQGLLTTVQYFPDPTLDRAGLVINGYSALATQSQGYDSRDVVVDPPSSTEIRGTRVFVSNRLPAAIVIGQYDSRGVLTFYENVAVPVGPSRIGRAVVNGKTFIVAASFDARSLFIYDPDARRATDVVFTNLGPYAIAVSPDVPGGDHFAYVANFTDSTVQVIDLDPAATESLIYTVGKPTGPKS